MDNYQDEVVVVTGAGSGMGRSYALEFARRGARLALGDVDGEALAQTLDLLPEATRKTAVSGVYDVADRTATFAFADEVADALGGASVVVNNAGIEGCLRPVWASEPADYDRVMAVNFSGVVHSTQAFLPQLLERPRGAVVNVSSIFGLVGTPSHSDYCASKFAVRGFTEALSAELLGTGVGVYLVHPGGIATRIARRPESQAFAQKYFGTDPADIARVVADAIGTRRTRIVYGQGSRKTWLGARLLPQRTMAGLIWRDISPVLDLTHYPAGAARSAER